MTSDHKIVVIMAVDYVAGLPKAATVSMQKYLSGMLLGGLFGFKSTDRVLTCLPLYHSNALMVGFAATIMFGKVFSCPEDLCPVLLMLFT